MSKHRFAPGEEVVVCDDLDATIYTIKSLHLYGVVNLEYKREDGEMMSKLADVSYLKYPTMGQYEAQGLIR